MITFDSDLKGLNRTLEGLSDALVGQGKDIINLVRDQGRLLNREIATCLPPFGSDSDGNLLLKGGNDMAVKPQDAGKKAISRELKSLFSEADPKLIDEIGSEHGIRGIDAFITKQDGSKLELKWDTIDPMGARMAEYHAANRNRRGKVPLGRREQEGVWRSRVVVPWGSRQPYIEKQQAKVGFIRASIAKAGMEMGETKYPAWVKKQVSKVGSAAIVDLSRLNDAQKPSVTFGTRVGGVLNHPRVEEFIRFAVKLRVKKVAALTKLVLRGYKKEQESGRRPTPQVKNLASTINDENR